MNKIKYSILLITALCISYSHVLAQVKDNSTEPASVKKGTSSFSASILRPLTVHDIQPPSIGPDEYVRGANYNLATQFGFPFCQYTIHGEKNRNFYIKIIGSTVGTDGKETKTLDNGRITLFVAWQINNTIGGLMDFDGTTNTQYLLLPQNGFGARVLTAFFKQLNIAADATPGLYEFEQKIEVSYNPF